MPTPEVSASKARRESFAPVDAIVLAGGKGSRFRSDFRPKVLHPLFGKPVLYHVLDSLAEALPLRRVLVVGCHLIDQLQPAVEAWSTRTGIDAELIDQETPNGTGHAVWQAVRKSSEPLTEQVVLACGDVPLIQADTWQRLLGFVAEDEAALALLTAEVPPPNAYGRIMVDEAGKALGIVEAKEATPEQQRIAQVNAGTYAMRWSAVMPVFEQLYGQQAQQAGECYWTDMVAALVKARQVCQPVMLSDADEMQGLNTRQDLAVCIRILNDRNQARLMAEGVTIIDPSACWIGPDVAIGQDSVVYPGTYIEGQVSIGRRCKLGPHSTLMGPLSVAEDSELVYAYVNEASVGSRNLIGPFTQVRNGVETGDNNKIGNFVEMKNVSIGSDNFVSHLAYLGDAELGDRVNIGAGAITANYNHISGAKEKTIIGSGVSLGANSVLVAPISVGERSAIGAGSVITRSVGDGDLTLARSRQVVLPGWVDKQLAKYPRSPIHSNEQPIRPLTADTNFNSTLASLPAKDPTAAEKAPIRAEVNE